MKFTEMTEQSNTMRIALDNYRFFLRGDWPDENGRYLETSVLENSEKFCRDMQKNSSLMTEEHNQNLRTGAMISDRMQELASSAFALKGVIEEAYIQKNGFEMNQGQSASDSVKHSESNQKLQEQFQFCIQGDKA